MGHRFLAQSASELSTAQLAPSSPRRGPPLPFDRARAKGANTHRESSRKASRGAGRDDEFEGVSHANTTISVAARGNGVGSLHVLTRRLLGCVEMPQQSNPPSA
jgi:hypothetical protein